MKSPMRRVTRSAVRGGLLMTLGALGAVAVLSMPALAQEEALLPKGLWQVRIFTPVPTPELKNEEQTFRLCYDDAAVKSRMNPVLPKAQAAQCKLDVMDLGDIAYDATCQNGDHRLRISQAAEGYWRGTYRFVAKEDGLILEPAVELKRIAETCG